MAKNVEKWKEAQKKCRLSDKHVQMVRELGLNPDKLGKINNHKQEPRTSPFAYLFGRIVFKTFQKT